MKLQYLVRAPPPGKPGRCSLARRGRQGNRKRAWFSPGPRFPGSEGRGHEPRLVAALRTAQRGCLGVPQDVKQKIQLRLVSVLPFPARSSVCLRTRPSSSFLKRKNAHTPKLLLLLPPQILKCRRVPAIQASSYCGTAARRSQVPSVTPLASSDLPLLRTTGARRSSPAEGWARRHVEHSFVPGSRATSADMKNGYVPSGATVMTKNSNVSILCSRNKGHAADHPTSRRRSKVPHKI